MTMADINDSRTDAISHTEKSVGIAQVEHTRPGPVVKVDSFRDDNYHINLTWRSWAVVL